jgi:hypothetical protein
MLGSISFAQAAVAVVNRFFFGIRRGYLPRFRAVEPFLT